MFSQELHSKRFFALACLALLFGGCSSKEKNHEAAPRLPSAQVVLQRQYAESPWCPMKKAELGASVVEPLSPLTGFAVGPTAAVMANDLKKPILRPFSTDGCSSSPDGIPFSENPTAWAECCVQHDTFYWLGGTAAEKQAADSTFESCVAEKANSSIAKFYRTFVDKFGGPNSIQAYRWGYGWNYKRPFSAITAQEEKQLQALYGVTKSNFSEAILKLNTPMYTSCTMGDPVFLGFSAGEKAVYAALNSALANPDQIDWARREYFNLKETIFEVRLRSCPQAFRITIPAKGTPVISEGCSNYLK